MTNDPTTFITTLVERLRTVPGVTAIVLGGSRARGNAAPGSDFDLGLYYQPDAPIDAHALEQVVLPVVDAPRPDLVTPIGEWGPWINGGGWLRVQGQPVDLLYRDLGRVAQAVDDCCAGRLEVAYQPGHPHAFVSAIYLGEIAHCRVLWDPDGVLVPLKVRAYPYPSALRAVLMARFGWEAGFSLENAAKGIGRGDVSYVAGCCFRVVACMMQALFALNEEYLLNEKGAVALAASFPLAPRDLASRVAAAFALLNTDPAALKTATESLAGLAEEIQALAARQTGQAAVEDSLSG
jgi:hypothetical protein